MCNNILKTASISPEIITQSSAEQPLFLSSSNCHRLRKKW